MYTGCPSAGCATDDSHVCPSFSALAQGQAAESSDAGGQDHAGSSHNHGARDGIPTLWRLGAGALSGLIAQTITYPLHVVRRRMQVGTATAATAAAATAGPLTKPEAAAAAARSPYSSVLLSLRHIASTEGVREGLFRGVTLTWLKVRRLACRG